MTNKVKGGSWVMHPETHKLVPKDEYIRPTGEKTYDILKPLEPFVSPIDGTEIRSRAQLAAHNKRHSVTNVQDYGDTWFSRKAKERQHALDGTTDQARRERRNAIAESIHRAEQGGNHGRR